MIDKTLNADLSVSSLKDLKNELESLKKNLKEETLKELLLKMGEKVVEYANENLANLRKLDDRVIIDIRTSWEIEVIDKTLTITNTSDKAVFIEFGVGAVAQNEPHPEAGNTGYRYNIPTIYKRNYRQSYGPDTWAFKIVGDEPIDIEIDRYKIKPLKDGELIITRGNPKAMYLHNAGLRLLEELKSEQKFD